MTEDRYELKMGFTERTRRLCRLKELGSHARRAAAERLGLDGDKWATAMARGGRFKGRAVGSSTARAEHLAQQGDDAKWIADKTPLYAETGAANATASP